MSTITTDNPTIRRPFGRLHRALARLDPSFRRDLHTVAANPAKVGAAGLVAGTYAIVPRRSHWRLPPDGRWACPTTAVLLLHGETTWQQLASYAAMHCFDALHDTPSFNDRTPTSAAIEDFNDALDEFAQAIGWATPGHGPDPARRGAVAVELQGLLLGLLGELDEGWS